LGQETGGQAVSDEEPSALVCMRYDEMHRMHPGQIINVCAECDAWVGVYPTGQRQIKRWPKMKILCNHCALVSHDPDVKVLPAGSVNEIVQENRDSYTVKK
jgi:hypothetical protein